MCHYQNHNVINAKYKAIVGNITVPTQSLADALTVIEYTIAQGYCDESDCNIHEEVTSLRGVPLLSATLSVADVRKELGHPVE